MTDIAFTSDFCDNHSHPASPASRYLTSRRPCPTRPRVPYLMSSSPSSRFPKSQVPSPHTRLPMSPSPCPRPTFIRSQNLGYFYTFWNKLSVLLSVVTIFLFRLMCNKIAIRFGLFDIQNNQGLGKGYQPQPLPCEHTFLSCMAFGVQGSVNSDVPIFPPGICHLVGPWSRDTGWML